MTAQRRGSFGVQHGGAQLIVAIRFVHRVDRLGLGVFSGNGPVIACHERQGFSRLGVWPSAFCISVKRPCCG
jgi:hypothetical protein